MVLAAAAPAAAERTEEVTLNVGGRHTIPAGDVRSYSVGARGIIDVRVARNGSALTIVGLEKGTTALLLVKRDGVRLRYVFQVGGSPGGG